MESDESRETLSFVAAGVTERAYLKENTWLNIFYLFA